MLKFAEAVKDAAGRVMPSELRGPERPAHSTLHQEVATRGCTRLLFFPPKAGVARKKTPIFFVYSLINRYYILDFMPGRSVLEYFTEQGHPCYVVDWGMPGTAESRKGWGDYLHGFIGHYLRTICEREQVPQAHLFGYCMGGTLALAYATLRPQRVKSFTALAVPVDFHDEGLLSLWTRGDFNVDALVDAFGNVPTWLMESGFRMLHPMSNLTKWRDLWQNREKDGFVEMWRAMESWSADNVSFPGALYRQYIRDCYQKNLFCKSEMLVEGERVDLTSIRFPLQVVAAEKDHIVPLQSAAFLMDVVASEDKEMKSFRTGHIGLSTSSKGRKLFWPEMEQWIAARS